MEYIYNKRLDEGYYKEILENGLTVFVYPMRNKSSVYAMLSAKVGSTMLSYELNGEEYNVPEGVAHFLEHKLFENEDGVDAFSLFALTGASANAYTSFDKTCYLFEASIEPEQSLRTLIRFVNSPYFTKETVAKEQGIIAQEIKMYRDHPSWRQLFELFKLMYSTHPIKNEIAGTVESIGEITPKILYNFYNTFYNPTNMVLAVSGNIEPETVLEICREEYTNKTEQNVKFVAKRYDDNNSIPEKRIVIDMPISAPQFCYGFKEIPFKEDEKVKKGLIFEMLLDIMCGQTSKLFRELYDGNLINDILSAEIYSSKDYQCAIFSAESSNPNRVIEAINMEIDRLKSEGIDKELFEECKRAYIGEIIGDFEDVTSVATGLTYSHFNDAGIYDLLSVIEEVELNDMQLLLNEVLRSDMSAAALVFPSSGESEE